MHPVDVDPVGLEPLQARLQRGNHGLAAIAKDQRVGIGRSTTCELGGEHEVFALALQQGAKQFFGLPKLIDIGRIDEIAAGLNIGIEDCCADIGIGAVAPAGSEVSGAERHLRYLEAGTAKDGVFHVLDREKDAIKSFNSLETDDQGYTVYKYKYIRPIEETKLELNFEEAMQIIADAKGVKAENVNLKIK